MSEEKIEDVLEAVEAEEDEDEDDTGGGSMKWGGRGHSYVKCEQKKPDCRFRAVGGYCLILWDTYFYRDCPFYKVIGQDLESDVKFERHGDETFRRIRGFGGRFLVSRSGLVVNYQGRPCNTRASIKGKPAVLLNYLDHVMKVAVEDIVAETYGQDNGAEKEN